MEKSEIIATVNKLPACFAFENGTNEIKVTYRGKRNDAVIIDTKNKEVSFEGKTESIAIQIAAAIGYTI